MIPLPVRGRGFGFLLAALVAFSAVLGALSADEPGREARIILLHTNDIHGAVLASDVRDKSGAVVGRRGGMAAVLSYVKRTREEAKRAGHEVILLDAGDFFQGTPEGDLPAGRLLIHLMNLARYDLLAPGNHDFDQGPAACEALARRAQFPFLCANVHRDEPESRRPDWVRPYLLREAHGLKIAFVGLITSEMPLVTTPKARQGLQFRDEMAALVDLLPRLDNDEAPDLKILVTHCGLETDKVIAERMPGIAVIVGGHSHTPLEQGWREPKSGTVVVQAGSSARWIGRTEIVVDLGTRQVVSITPRLVPLDVGEVGEDPDALALIRGFSADLDREMNVEVGSATDEIGRNTGASSSPLGNLLCDIMRHAAGAQIAFHNRTGTRADLPPGILRMRDMYKVSPFSNTLVAMDLSGADLLDLLDNAVSSGTRLFLEASGVTAVYDASAPAGRRIVRATVHEPAAEGRPASEAPIDPTARYRVVTNSFLAKGGDGHAAFTRGTNVKETGINLLDAQVEYFRANSPVAPVPDPRIRPGS